MNGIELFQNCMNMLLSAKCEMYDEMYDGFTKSNIDAFIQLTATD